MHAEHIASRQFPMFKPKLNQITEAKHQQSL